MACTHLHQSLFMLSRKSAYRILALCDIEDEVDNVCLAKSDRALTCSLFTRVDMLLPR